MAYNERAYLRNKIAQCINKARYASSKVMLPGYDREGCKRTAHNAICEAIAARDLLSRLGFKLP